MDHEPGSTRRLRAATRMFAGTSVALALAVVSLLVALAKTGGYAMLVVVPAIPVAIVLATQAGYGVKLARLGNTPIDNASFQRTLTGVIVCDLVLATGLTVAAAMNLAGW